MTFVQFLLESIIPELEDYRKREIFTESELSQIVQSRKRYEELLQRRITNVEDFIRCVHYELELFSRVQLARRLQMKRDENGRSALSDVAIPRRIHGLFGRALKKRPGDKSLWLTFIDVASFLKSDKALSRIFGMVVQKLPREPGFWIMAAAFECNAKRNFVSARTLLQRGLRINPDSTRLWAEYFRFELLYSEWRVLLEVAPPGDEIAAGALPAAVLKSALSTERPFSFIESLFAVFDDCASGSSLAEFFPRTLGCLVQHVEENIVPVYPPAISFLAARLLPPSFSSSGNSESLYESLKKAFTFLNGLFESNPSSGTLLEVASFITGTLRDRLPEEDQEECREIILERLRFFYNFAKENGFLDEKLYLFFLNQTPIFDGSAQEKKAVLDLALEKHPSSLDLWKAKALFLAKEAGIDSLLEGGRSFFGQAKEHISNFPLLVHALIEQYTGHCPAGKPDPAVLVKLLALCSSDMKLLVSAICLALGSLSGSSPAVLSDFYLQLGKAGGIPVANFEICLLFAKASSPNRDHADMLSFPRKMFERALLAQPSSLDALLSYIRMEHSFGNLREAGFIYKRAVSSIKDQQQLDLFQREYSCLK